tara:strand:+ start:550 stop:846 length:297 start_codon:yes stop_codon:yes gene_type:complete
MNYDHDAILKAYEGVVVYIRDDFGCLDKDNNPVTIDQAKVDEARKQLDVEIAATKYRELRRYEYPKMDAQLDYIYHNGVDKWKTDMIDPIKKKYPKPE